MDRIKSSTEFIDLLHGSEPEEDIAALDAESLFTNAPVDETINLALTRIYHTDREPLPVSERTLKSMLEACTEEAPFLSHKGDLFRQCDGIAMESPLGVLFANIYTDHVETTTFVSHQKPRIYARYIDDVFITMKDKNEATKLAVIFAFLSFN
ncbi:uncharacterized protein [Macrobrachium rosenbergii]|uniref:uncharacterized protein n=1 Tax=Macrobrachium rosenbergii TaxID=79674 RepID=UPI0034D5D79C